MKNDVEIRIDTKVLEKKEKQLAELYKKIESRRLNVHFSQGKGNVVNELLEIASQLNEIGESLGVIIKKTETVVMKTRVSFIETDNLLAHLFESEE